ncbi:MobC family plasmid mobilization relaxosome protein [Ruthenibacterium lactatiformans]|uniref:MobC family plasmid mobilization relaxosome protein n=1 Tax=Ruthenibacterium lactatiformans TaxID=1550024 RepID=UPI003B8A758C
MCKESGLGKSEVIRNLIMGVEIKPRPTEEQLRLVREISGIANNINQITRLANTVKSVSPAQVEELQRLCSKALSLVKESI